MIDLLQLEQADPRAIMRSILQRIATGPELSKHVDSSELAFSNAGAIAFKRACPLASPLLLEPVCKLEVVTPAEYLGDVLGQLNAKRCEVVGTELRPDGTQTIQGHVPLSKMFGYATDLRSSTQGRALFTMEFDHYAPVQERITSELLTKWGIKKPHHA